MIRLLALLALALAACGPSVTASWTSSSNAAPGTCLDPDAFDDRTPELVRVELAATDGTVLADEVVPCRRDGFSLGIPDGLTQLDITVGVYPGDWATAGATILPNSAPRWERAFTADVTDADIDLGALSF